MSLEEQHKWLCENLSAEAQDFLKLHNTYVHLVDDVIDEADLSIEKKLEAFGVALKYYQHPYYLRNIASLSIVTLLNHIDYKHSAEWERSRVGWKVEAARILRHTSISVLFAVIAIELGIDKAIEVSGTFREYTFIKHLEDKPVA